jgi:hypothetical protein
MGVSHENQMTKKTSAGKGVAQWNLITMQTL